MWLAHCLLCVVLYGSSFVSVCWLIFVVRWLLILVVRCCFLFVSLLGVCCLMFSVVCGLCVVRGCCCCLLVVRMLSFCMWLLVVGMLGALLLFVFCRCLLFVV